MAQQPVIDRERDEFIAEAVAQALDELTEVRESRTPVAFTVENGVVTVSGAVFTEILRRRILFAAATIPGVTKVIDQLSDDEDLKVFVAQALSDPAVLGAEAARVIVASYQGVITLSGRITGEPKRAAALEAAQKVPGVRTVIDNLKIA